MSKLLKEINLDNLISQLLNKISKKNVISDADYLFAKNIIHACCFEPRENNFCVDLTKASPSLADWSKNQCKALGKLFSLFSNEAALVLEKKQQKGIATNEDVQMLWLKLPQQNDSNRKQVNEILHYAQNNAYDNKTGNENWISLQKYINNKKPNPIVPYTRTVQSVSVLIVTDTDKVLLLKRGGGSLRSGSWGTLTGMVEKGEDINSTVVREVHEEINYMLTNREAHYVGIAYTPNLGKDLTEKNKAVTYADDCSYVYGILIPEAELIKDLKLDEENAKWRLFDRDALHMQFKSEANKLPVALAKSLLALDAAKDNFSHIMREEVTYSYTNSLGFLAHFQNKNTEKESKEVEVVNTLGIKK